MERRSAMHHGETQGQSRVLCVLLGDAVMIAFAPAQNQETSHKL